MAEKQQRVIRHAVDLEERLTTRKLVDRAQGALVERQGLSEKDACQHIQHQARD